MVSEESRAEIFSRIVKDRYSTRAYLDFPISRDILRQIFGLAQSAPSNCNTQPWLVYIVSGARLVHLRNVFATVAATESFTMDIPFSSAYPSVYKVRQYDAAARLYGAMKITREDKRARAAAFMRNYSFYDAPHVAFICMPAFAGVREAADVGMYVQTLMLAMTAYGIGSCAQTSLSMYAQPIKAELTIPVDQQLLMGISFGYADDAAAANTARMPRAELVENVNFVD